MEFLNKLFKSKSYSIVNNKDKRDSFKINKEEESKCRREENKNKRETGNKKMINRN